MPMNKPEQYQLTDFFPTTKKEMEIFGWSEADVILFTGDAYIDHPSFGAAVIARVMQAEGLRVVVVPQPNWQDDLRDFKKMGKPRMFFAVTAGNMDSMVNHYTANKRIRSDDAYTADGRPHARPDYATTVYCNILKKIFPDVPIVIGGIEASLRRITHYDYWSDQLMPGILIDSKADLLIYGMAEKSVRELIKQLNNGKSLAQITEIPQTAFIVDTAPDDKNSLNTILLVSHEECLQDKKKYASNFRTVEEESNKISGKRLIQQNGSRYIIINPLYPPWGSEELDETYRLPFTRMPHPKYRGKTIPAYEMIKFSVNLHRGCFGGCAFCTISAHQGKFIVSRSKQSIMDEVKQITKQSDFKGNLSDLGGPSANMYNMQGRELDICEKCKRPSCIFPKVCYNLDINHEALTDVYRSVDKLPQIKHSYIGSGIRYDMLLTETKDESIKKSQVEYIRELVGKHVSGRLKIAPEHTSDSVLKLMRKPSFDYFYKFKKIFDEINKEKGLNQQLIPYFISSHPACNNEDMAELAAKTKDLNFRLEQIQDFTPTPMTLATEIYYSGYHPYTLQPIYTAKTKQQKLEQRKFFFWYKNEYRQQIMRDLKNINRPDLIKKMFG